MGPETFSKIIVCKCSSFANDYIVFIYVFTQRPNFFGIGVIDPLIIIYMDYF